MLCIVAVTSVTDATSSSVALSSPREMLSDVTSAATATSSSMSQLMTAVSMPTEQPQPVVATAEQLVSSSSSSSASDASIMSKLSGLLSMLPMKPTLQPTMSLFQPTVAEFQPTVSVSEPSSNIPSSSPSPPLTTPATTSAAPQVSSDGSVTPVKDEVEEKVASPTPELPPSQQPKVVDPIALLNQMLSQSRPSTTSSSSSVNFLQSLTMLTKTVTSAGPTSTGPDDDDIYMGSYGKLDDQGSFTTTWSNCSRSDADTGPPVKPLDHETSQTVSTTVSVPIPLASQSMGPPSLRSIYGMAAGSDVAGSSSSPTASVTPPVNASTSLQDHVLSSESVNNRFPSLSTSLDPADASEKFSYRSDSTHETPYPLPGLDMVTAEDSGRRGGPLQENNLTASFLFRPTDTTAPQNVLPADEFTERLRRKTSLPFSDGMASPPFPDSRSAMPVQTGNRMFDEGGTKPPLEPPAPNNFPSVCHDQPEADSQYDRYGERFDEWATGDDNRKELPMSSLRPLDPTFQNKFLLRQPVSPRMFPRPDFFPEPRRRMPLEDFRPRFMSRLPPPSAFSSLRSPPPPPPERFQRPFYPRF